MPESTTPDQRVLEVLRASGVFGSLEEVVLYDLARLLHLQVIPGGNIVYREGDPANTMFFLISGRLRVSRRDRNGVLQLYNEIRPGESVGEAGLILQQPRAADITALRDSTVALLSRADFERLLVLHPLPLNRVFARAIYNHLRHASQRVERRHAQIFVVVPLESGALAHAVAQGLTRAFAQIGRAWLVPPDSDGVSDPNAPGGWSGNDRYDDLEEQYDFLIYEADLHSFAWTRRAFRQADQVIFVSTPEASTRVGELEQRLASEPGFEMKRKHLVLLHAPTADVPAGLIRWQHGRDCERVYPVRAGHAADFARLARFLNGTAVGVVLGGGGARGFAHLGVLQALEQAGIVIDLIGGNSMGALIGAQYACGMGLDEIRERTVRFARGGERPTIPVISLVSGRRVERDLQRMFGERTVDQLWRPFFAAACNLSRACTTVQDNGPLWRAVLASNSPVGLFPPVLHQGDLLVDGAILENVPVQAMRARLGTPLEQRRGNGTIIAIDVDVRDYMGVDPTLARLSVRRTIKSYFRRGSPSSPGIGDILYRASHIGGLHQRARTIAQSDHYLEPPVAAFPLMGYGRAEKIVDVGYRYAVQEIARWDASRIQS
ncbi:MAG: cyclic nucleotide-binding and patatin-like phospholipase domain-containing protein [Burkholderiaceae bacterium]